MSRDSQFETQPVGLLGVGLVGSALAARLIAAGYSVRAYDPAPEAKENIERVGAQLVSDARAVGRLCRRIVLSLPGIDQVRSVVSELLNELRTGDTIVDTTTSDPEHVEEIGRTLQARGIEYVDATLGGSSRLISAGEAIVMCGATETGFANAKDLLESFGRAVFHIGPGGSGIRMKLVFNLMLGLERAILAEALEFARHSGIDPGSALQVLRAGPAYAGVMDTKGPKMIAGDFTPEARLAQHWKDVQLMLASAEKTGATLPFTKLHEELLSAACDYGLGARDNSAIIKVFQERSRR